MSENEHTESDEIVDGVDLDGIDEVSDAPDASETGESGEEGIAGIPANDELAAALKEAEDAVDERQAKRAAGDDAGADSGQSDSADKMTIELLAEELQSLKGEHEKALAGVAETEDKLLRLQAEFENFRRRTLKEKQDTFKYGAQNLVKDLLATVDNLERAVAHGEESKDGNFESLLEGVELVRNELLGILSNHGVVTIEAENMIFDPEVHEAMAQVPSDEVPINTVMQVLQPGYMLRDRMLRPARVIVSKPVDEAAALAATPAEEAPPAEEETAEAAESEQDNSSPEEES